MFVVLLVKNKISLFSKFWISLILHL